LQKFQDIDNVIDLENNNQTEIGDDKGAKREN
jgi:hypothetical protein